VAEVLLFHHALGRTAGVRSFADRLRAAGHVVHVPDLYEGATFADIADGLAHVKEIGFGAIMERGLRAAGELPEPLVYAGFSLGVMPAQQLAQHRAGARGALLMNGCVPPGEFGTPWPAGLPVQIHTRADDELGDAEVAQEFAATVPGAELFLYPGDRHLFVDDSLPDFDADAAALLEQRVLEFLGRLG
jgi:dienelactone hydrolase